MPHLIIEYSANLEPAADMKAVVKTAHKVLADCGLFPVVADIKTRAYRAENFLVGEKGTQASFVHARVYLLEGRTVEQKKGLSEKLRDALQRELKNVDQLSVDIRDMVKDTYRKQVA